TLLDTVVNVADLAPTISSRAVQLPARSTKPPPLPVKPPPLPVASEPPAVRVPPLPPLPSVDPSPTVVLAVPPASPASVARIDPIQEAACSPRACRGLTSRRALHWRLKLTHQLLYFWKQVGKHVASPQKRLKRATKAEELDHDLMALVDLLPRFP